MKDLVGRILWLLMLIPIFLLLCLYGDGDEDMEELQCSS